VVLCENLKHLSGVWKFGDRAATKSNSARVLTLVGDIWLGQTKAVASSYSVLGKNQNVAVFSAPEVVMAAPES
jgi:hypothetical protein